MTVNSDNNLSSSLSVPSLGSNSIDLSGSNPGSNSIDLSGSNPRSKSVELSTSSPSSNSIDLSAPKPSNPIAPSQSQQISITDRPVLKLRDPAADQRTQASKQGHAQRAKDFLAEAQQIEEELDQMLHVRSRRLADAISAAPFRFDELFVERANAHNYDYSEIEATNAAIRDMWKD